MHLSIAGVISYMCAEPPWSIEGHLHTYAMQQDDRICSLETSQRHDALIQAVC